MEVNMPLIMILAIQAVAFTLILFPRRHRTNSRR